MATKDFPLTRAEVRELVYNKQLLTFKKSDELVLINDYAKQPAIRGYVSTGSVWLDLAIGWPRGRGLPLPSIVEIVGTEMSGKAQPLSARLVTPTGWSTMGMVKVGDTIQGKNGWTTVVAIHPRGLQAVYRVSFSDGTAVECTADHLWEVQKQAGHKKITSHVLTTANLQTQGLRDPRYHDGWRWRVPFVQPVEFPPVGLPIDPYVLGLLLGNGNFTRATPRFSSCELELVASMAQRLPSTMTVNRQQSDAAVVKHPDKIDWSLRGNDGTNVLTQQLVSLGLMGRYSIEKWIPNLYKYASVQDRVAILQGLMDTDGTVDKKRGHPAYLTGSKQLASDIQELVESLGGMVTITLKYAKKIKPDSTYYQLQIRLPERFCPFRLERKKALLKPHTFYRKIVDIQLVGREECQCITVSAADGLYCTDHYAVTHNSGLAYTIGGMIQRMGGWVLLIDEEDTFDEGYAVLFKLNTSMEQFQWARATSLESVFRLIRTTINEHYAHTNDIPLCIIWDSLAGTCARAEKEAIYEEKETKRALHAGIIATQLREIMNLMRPSADQFDPLTRQPPAPRPFTFLVVNQLKSAMPTKPWEEKLSAFGGRAFKYHARCRLEIQRKEKLNYGTDKIIPPYGFRCKAIVLKNKVGAPWRDTTFDLDFTTGIDDYECVIEHLKNSGTIQKSGVAHLIFGGRKWYQSQLRDKAATDPVVWDQLRELLFQTLSAHYSHSDIQPVVSEQRQEQNNVRMFDDE